ncbi:hypothetical protein V1477_000359 [Vespula maculifrons]|uniref:Uncharacterized protein n=1 Tax=Vespula maculifrons TaxID=7453 RepID=A0ABD2D1L5_VESMC
MRYKIKEKLSQQELVNVDVRHRLVSKINPRIVKYIETNSMTYDKVAVLLERYYTNAVIVTERECTHLRRTQSQWGDRLFRLKVLPLCSEILKLRLNSLQDLRTFEEYYITIEGSKYVVESETIIT